MPVRTWGELTEKSNRFEAEIIGFEGDPLLHERLFEMGLALGLTLKVLGRAPFKGPWVVQWNMTMVALRQEEAEGLRLRWIKNL